MSHQKQTSPQSVMMTTTESMEIDATSTPTKQYQNEHKTHCLHHVPIQNPITRRELTIPEQIEIVRQYGCCRTTTQYGVYRRRAKNYNSRSSLASNIAW
jgi:hypothetical protein